MENVWIIGAGTIAQEYAKVLGALNQPFVVIGRGNERAEAFENTIRHEVVRGGLENFLLKKPEMPKAAIVATNLETLAGNCISLIKYGVRRIFCEKPGFLCPEELTEVLALVQQTQTKLFLAYNRRFYASTLAAKKVIQEDGGVSSFCFEFTEWGHVIAKANKPKDVLANWFYANSSHVVDLAFYLGGEPACMSNYVSGELSWHKPAIFAGSGESVKGALFSYQANWAAPGRWWVEILTQQHRLIFRPMEELSIQNIGSVAINKVEIDDHLDKQFKPGFYLETKAFIEGQDAELCDIAQQCSHIKNIYDKILCR